MPALFLLTASLASAQEKTTVDGNNDLKVNILYGLFETIEIDYERIISDNAGVGLAASVWFEDDIYLDYLILPYFRFYPSDTRRAAAFFIEANMALVGSTNQVYYANSQKYVDEKYTSFGFGVAVGGKFVSKSGFLGEVFLGVGREFNDESWIETYPRLGITLGKRF